MSNYEATKYDFDGANLTGIEGIPTATIVPWSDSSVPSGFLECNGQAVSQSTYAALFAIIGTTYGDPGGGNFNVPDLQDNVPVGKSNNKALGSTGGANTVAVTPSGNIAGSTANATLSESQLASHSHNMGGNNPGNQVNFAQTGVAFGVRSLGGNANQTGNVGSGSGHSHNMSANFSGTASNPSVLQPYLTVIYIIKT
jgi:microcystin-dependent protein